MIRILEINCYGVLLISVCDFEMYGDTGMRDLLLKSGVMCPPRLSFQIQALVRPVKLFPLSFYPGPSASLSSHSQQPTFPTIHQTSPSAQYRYPPNRTALCLSFRGGENVEPW